MNSLQIWILAYLLTIGLLFWFLYKALKSKNIKYAYGVGLSLLMMIVMLFL